MSRRNYVEEYYSAFLDNVPVGRRNAIVSADMVDRLGIPSGGRGPQDNRVLRSLAQRANMEGHAVAGDGEGYYFPETFEEGMKAVLLHERKIATLQKRLDAYMRALNKRFKKAA